MDGSSGEERKCPWCGETCHFDPDVCGGWTQCNDGEWVCGYRCADAREEAMGAAYEAPDGRQFQ